MKRITLGDVAFEAKNTFSGDRNDVPVVGLEHLDPCEVQLSRWDSNSENTFTKSFHKGEVLFGRRRAYLKKAAVAPFDGICSGDITVIAAKDGKIQPELLPFIIQSERFFDYAVKGSAGSLSPRVKWEHLKSYEFELPPIEEQRKLADLLWAAYELKESYKKLLAATDEMVKAKFIEMFGDPMGDSYKFKPFPISDLALELFAGGDKPTDNSLIKIGEYQYPVYSNGETNDGLLCFSQNYRIDKTAITISARGTIGYTVIRNAFFTPVVRLITIVPKDILNIIYLKNYLDSLSLIGTGSSQSQLTLPNVKKINVILPPIELQNKFSDFVKQADVSKAELNGAIAKLEQVMKSLLP